MSRNILVVCGSPLSNGNTNALADAFIRGAEEAGNTITKLWVGNKKISGCRGCRYCMTHDGVCVQKDDMVDVLPLFYNHDMVVFSTPVYFFGLTAQIKTMIDRLYPALTKPFSISAAAFLSVMGDTNEATMEPSIMNYKAIIKYLKWENKGIITAGGIDEKGAIEGHEILDRAEAFGRGIS